MKIAFITDDGKTISQHFGRAAHYLVVELANSHPINRELRDKLGHKQFVKEEEESDHSLGSGIDVASHRKHDSMADAIRDCEVLICGGMGRGAYQSMEIFGIKPIVTDIMGIDEALQAYLAGDLKDHIEKLH